MPVLDGWGTLDELRADERTRPIPCVAVSAFADAEHDRAIEYGFDGYLSKPYRSQDLLRTIESLLARAPAPNEVDS
jgi:two-component system cell cycle response regulator DivK